VATSDNVLTLSSDAPDAPAGLPLTVRARSVNLGRGEGNDLVLGAAHISSRHAVIRWGPDGYLFADLGSTNGSCVERGGERIIVGPKGVPDVALRSGDLLVLGDVAKAVRLRVELRSSTLPPVRGEPTVVSARTRPELKAVSERLSAEGETLRALYRLVSAVSEAGTEGDRILARVAEAALETIPGAVDALVVVPAGDGFAARAQAHRGRGVCHAPDLGVCRRVLAGEEAALLFGQCDDAELPAATLVSRGVGSGIAAALLGSEGDALGVLQVNCAGGRSELGDDHLDLAVVLAHHAAVALERAQLIARLRAAEERLREENTLLRRRVQPASEGGLVAESPAMKRVLAELDRAAESDTTVLLLGETGSGKEVAARYLHERSRRRGGLLVPVNCGALSETLLDSELFGHRKGAFTGASSDRKGIFEVAAGGTVFLDEVGEMPASVQVRLLRVIEESKIKVVGDSVERAVDVRVIAATNRDLHLLVQEGRFRQDLYYRLRVFPVTLPPLRERPEDIEPLCRLFAERSARRLGKQIGPLDPPLADALRHYSFPGNVRELANELERVVVRAAAGEPLVAELLSDEVLTAAARCSERPLGAGKLADEVARVERELIAEALARHGGNRAAAARELGLSRQGLAKKVERLKL
jgi:Nif-specific regulatory protein